VEVSVPGQIVILNGVPCSGKSSVATAIQETFDGVWLNLGVDGFMRMTPARYLPGMGLRPGGERPDLEKLVSTLYAALYASIAAHSRTGLNVVVDVAHHDAYASPRSILPSCAQQLEGLPVLFVGVRCPLEVIMKRRRARGWDSTIAHGDVPKPVRLWQQEVHKPGIYDLEVDTSRLSPEACAVAIRTQLEHGLLQTAFQRLAARTNPQ
jgi:chloramphenicol 3-O phosphotransferase